MSKSRSRREKYFDARRCAPIAALHPVSGKEITVDFQKDAMIRDIDEDLIRLPGTISWYIQLRDIAETEYKYAKHHELNTMEDLNIVIRDEMDGKVTETQLKTRVLAHPKMRKAFRKRMSAESRYRALKSAVEVLIEKKWALQALVNHRKTENNPDAL